jgi:tetratricopeptide (TPR) repeat protein
MFGSLRMIGVLFGLIAAAGALSGQTGNSTGNPEAQKHLAQAQQALANRQLDLAGEELHKALIADSANVEARANLGMVEFLQGKYVEASNDLRQALTLQPKLWKAHAILGLSDKALGSFDSARSELAKSFSHLDDPQLQMRVGMASVELDYQQHDLDAALAVLASLRKIELDNPDVLYVTYRIHSDLSAQARDALAAVAPDSARMHQLLAEHLVTEGKIRKAIDQYREALRIDPRLPGVHFELGEAILEDSTSDQAQQQARQEFETALKINPGDAKSESRLGALANLHNEKEIALQHYSHATELDPEYSDAQIGLGAVLMSTGKAEEALEHLLQAIRVDPMNASAHYRLSQAYRQLGHTAQADEEIARFKQLRESEERLQAAYDQVNEEAGVEKALQPDLPK